MADKRKRVVIKLGTGILTKATRDGLDTGQFRRLSGEIAESIHAGTETVVVTSGAVGAGLMQLKLTERPSDLPSVQAAAAIGQSRLMRLYATLFGRHGLHVAQLLLTHQDLDSRTRCQNARNTLERLLRFGNIVPIINENDSVVVEELRFGDNDLLSAEVAILSRADLLVILTSVEGLLGEDNQLIPEVTDIDAVAGLAKRETGVYSRGGMVTKLQAAKLAVRAGIPVVIASGLRENVIRSAVGGAMVGTRFVPS
jgi:glutamate 5-kinase